MRKPKLNIAIIDDERHAIETLAYDLRESFPQSIQIVFTETNPFEGARQARLFNPDILFLDIMMPGLSGFELIKLINDLSIKVILTTAHPEMLTVSREAGASDCLLKPVSIPELEDILNKTMILLRQK